MWLYSQGDGEMRRDNKFRGYGYSGYAQGKNNPLMQSVRNTGPIPRGEWKIGPPRDSALRGPFTLPLTPCEGTDTLGRSHFLIHGDSKKRPGFASHGCIILSRTLREEIWESGDHELTVTR